MQKITTCLWLDGQAEEAAKFYTSAFENSRMGNVVRYPDAGQEAGTVMTVDFELEGFGFTALNGGPAFTPNPSISFIVNFDPLGTDEATQRQRLDKLWKRLTDGGEVLLQLDEYPFSKRYGWVQDKFGISWQLMLTEPEANPRPTIMPSLLFIKDNYGKAEEATDFHISVFKDSKRGQIAHYPAGMEPNKEGTTMFTDYMLEGQWFVAMDSAQKHDYPGFNEAISFVVNCKDQAEIDYYWEKLSAVPESEQCGWLKDKYGVSWQISPTEAINEMMQNADEAATERYMEAMLKMKKLDIAKLRDAIENK